MAEDEKSEPQQLAGCDDESTDDPDHDPEAWAHVDPDHPRPWDGCIRRGLCCRTSPGWFAPGEAERAAAHLGLEMGDFVNRYLVLDRIQTTIGRIEAFAPVKLGRDGEPVEPTGERTSDAYHLWQGACIFYGGEEAGCRIYPVRPLECRLYCCTNLPEDNPAKLDLGLLWLGAWQDARDGQGAEPRPIADVAELRRMAEVVKRRTEKA